MIIDTIEFEALWAELEAVAAELEALRGGYATFDTLAEEARQQLAEAGRILARPRATAAAAGVLHERLGSLVTALEHAGGGAYALEQAIAEGIRVGELRAARHAHGVRHVRPRHGRRPTYLRLVGQEVAQ